MDELLKEYVRTLVAESRSKIDAMARRIAAEAFERVKGSRAEFEQACFEGDGTLKFSFVPVHPGFKKVLSKIAVELFYDPIQESDWETGGSWKFSGASQPTNVLKITINTSMSVIEPHNLESLFWQIAGVVRHEFQHVYQDFMTSPGGHQKYHPPSAAADAATLVKYYTQPRELDAFTHQIHYISKKKRTTLENELSNFCDKVHRAFDDILGPEEVELALDTIVRVFRDHIHVTFGTT